MEFSSLAQTLVVIFLVHYTAFFFSLLFKKNRESTKHKNTELEKLRRIASKTVEQQKRFLELRYPKKPPFKWKWVMLPKIVWMIVKYGGLFYVWFKLVGRLNPSIWFCLAFIFIFPFVVVYGLKRFKLNDNNTLVEILRLKRNN